MRTLQSLLTILDGQKLAPGYLTPLGPTALEHMIALKKLLDTNTINGGAYQPQGDLLFKEACEVAIDHGHFKMAWIGVVDHRAQRIVPIGLFMSCTMELIVVPMSDRRSLRIICSMKC